MKFLEHVPVSSDPCGRLQYGVPNDNTEHQSLGRGDYTLSNSQSLFAPLHVRGLRQSRAPTTARTP